MHILIYGVDFEQLKWKIRNFIFSGKIVTSLATSQVYFSV